jgi:hypothetical protein
MKKWTMFISCMLPVLQMSTLNSSAMPRDLNVIIKDVKYCAMLKDGKMMLMKENETVTSDITLKDGSIMTKDGTVMRKNGTKVMLQNGECIDEQGQVLSKNKKPESKEHKNNYDQKQNEEKNQ